MPVGVVSARNEMVPPLVSRSELPFVAPMVNAERAVLAALKLMFLMFSHVLLIVMVVPLLDRNVAVSALLTVPNVVSPGKRVAPVLQLVPLGTQSPLVGVALHVADPVASAAWSGSKASARSKAHFPGIPGSDGKRVVDVFMGFMGLLGDDGRKVAREEDTVFMGMGCLSRGGTDNSSGRNFGRHKEY